MPTKKSGKKRLKAAGKVPAIPVPGKIEKIHDLKEVKPADIGPVSAPLLPGADLEPMIRPAKHKIAARVVKHHAVKHVRILQAKSTAVAIHVSNGYKKADAVAVRTVKKAIPETTRKRLADNQTANNGNMQFYVPLAPKIIPHKVKVVVPAKLRHIRHAALPVALIAVLLFAMRPAGAAPSYGGTSTFGGSGADQAKSIAVDPAGNTYTVGNFTGTVDFAAGLGGGVNLFSDDFDDGDLSSWDTTDSITASTDRSLSGSYSAKSESVAAPSYAEKDIAPTSQLTLSADVNADNMSQDIDFFVINSDSHVYTIYRSYGSDALCAFNGNGFLISCTGNNVLTDDTWKHVEFRLTAGASGRMQVYVEDVLVIDFGTDMGTDPFNKVIIGNTLNRTGTTYLDNVEIATTSDEKSSDTGSQDMFVTKTNANGTYGWTKRLGGAETDMANGVTVDSNGNVYVAGNFEDTADFAEDWGSSDEKTSTGDTDAFVTEINANGTYGNTWQIGSTGSDNIAGLAIDSSNNVYAAGSFSDTVVFDTDFGSTSDSKASAGGTDAFVTQITSAGGYGWTKHMGGTTNDVASAVVVSGSSVFVAGTFTGAVNFAADWSDDNTRTSSESSVDTFLTKMGTNGSLYDWTRVVGDDGIETATAVAVNAGGDIYLVGMYDDVSLNFAADWEGGNDTKASAGDSDGFITKINNDDSYGWTHTIGSSGTESVNGVGVDGDGNLYVGGSFGAEDVNFAADWSDTDTKTNAGLSDAFVSRLGADGSYGWTATFGDSGSDELLGLAVDGDDIAHIAGSFSGTVNFQASFSGTDTKVSEGSTDAFITKVTNVPDIHTIADASGLTYEDADATNLSSTGTTETNPTVYVHDQDDDTMLATIDVDLSEDRDWSAATGDSDLNTNKMFVNDVIGAPGAAADMTLYVPRDGGDKAVVLCPGATTLAAVTKTCASKITYTDNDSGVATTTMGGQSYWTITGIDDADIGAMSRAFPGMSVTETSGNTAVTEAGASDYISVQLNAEPTNDVTVTLTPSISGRLDTLAPLTFTAANWDDPQTVLLQPVNNDTLEGNDTINLSYSTDSADTNYDGTSESDVVSIGWTDDDEAGVVWQNVDNLTDEAGNTAEVCVTLTAQPSDPVTLHVGSADTGEITLSGSTIAIDPEDWDAATNCVTATGQDDNLTDGPQDVAISVTSIDSDDTHFSGLDTGDIVALTLTNQDDDTASFTVTASDPAETTEAGGTAEICVTLSARPNSGSVTIPLSVTDASEASLGASSLVIAAADWDQSDNCVTITGQDDDMDDGDVAYEVTTGDPTAADPAWSSLGASDIANPSYTNIDDDEAGLTIVESSGTTAVTESGTTDTITVRLTTQPAATKQVVVQVQPDAQLSIGGEVGAATQLTFDETDWDTPQTVTVTADDDTSVEGAHNGAVELTIDASTTEAPYDGLDPEEVAVAITDNDIATASIATTNDATEDPAENGVFHVSLSSPNNTGSAVAVNYSVGGTAVAGTHYASLTGSVSIPNGQSSADITVDVSDLDNDVLEGNKTVILTLTSSPSPSVGVSEDDDAATVVVFDDETAAASISISQQGDEDGPVNIEFTVTMTTENHTGAPISFDIAPAGGTATAGDDYTNFAGSTIDVPDGSATGTLSATVTDDSLLEASNETVLAAISNSSHAAVSITAEEDTATANLTDNDTAEVNVTVTDTTAAENPASSGEFTIAIDKTNNTGSTIQFTYSVGGTATADSDYDALSGSASIPNGQDSVTVLVDTTGHDDNNQEGSETVIVNSLGNNLGGGRITVGTGSSATVTIADDEGAGVQVTVNDDTTSENGGTAEICFELTSHPSADVTIELSSADDSKVTIPSSITILEADWDQSDNCVTATGQDDATPIATGTEDVVITTGTVTSGDSFYAAINPSAIEDVTLHHADNDTASVTVQTAQSITSEDGQQSAVVKFSLTSRPSDDVTIPLTVSDSTEGSISVTEIVIAAVDWNDPDANVVTISGVDDDLTDGDIAYQLGTGNPTSDDPIYDALDSSDVANPTLTNEDDDEARISARDNSNEMSSVTEGGTTDTQYIKLETQPAPGNQVVITVTPANSQLNIGAGAGTAIEKTFDETNWNVEQSVTVTAVDDSLLESGQLVAVNYTINTDDTTEAAYLDYQYGLPAVGAQITDNDTATANLSKSNGSETGPANASFTVTLSKVNNTDNPITFALDPSGGTATVVDDYADFTGAALSVAVGDTTATQQVTIVNDTLLEGTETITGALSNSSFARAIIGTASASANITDNDTTLATITASDASAQENSLNSGQFTVSLDHVNHTGSAITVDYTTTGSATSGSDYTALSGTASIADGSDTATITVTTNGHDDKLIEGNETVIVTLDAASHPLVAIGSPSSATVTIAEDDTPSVTITASGGTTNVTEGGATDTQSVEIGTQPAPGQEVVITATPANSQINLGAGAGTAIEKTFTNGNWDTPQTVTITAVDDSLLESNHSSSVVYSINTTATTENAYDSYSGLPTLTVNITDNDTATANLSKGDGSETGPANASFTVTLSKTNNTGSPITFALDPNGGTATAVSDYANFGGTTLSVANGATTATRQVTIVDDSLLEGTETIGGLLTNSSLGVVTIGTDTTSANVTDNDATTVTITATDNTAAENPSASGEFTVDIGKVNNTGSAITVNYSVSGTATASEDYVALTGSVNIANGASTALITVDTTGLNDDSVEGDETVTVTLTGTNHGLVTVGNPDDATVTIADDDSPGVTISASGGSTNVTEGGATDTQSVGINTKPAAGKQVVIRATPSNSQINLGAGAGVAIDKTFTDSNWDTPQTVTVTAVDDSLLESSHISNVVYSINTAATDDDDYDAYVTPLPTLTVSITDNDTATASLSSSNGSEAGPTSITYTVTLSKTNNTGSAITVALNPSGGTATVTSDYANFASTTVSIANGASTGSASVGVVDDGLLEGTETVLGTISSPSLGAVTIGTASASANITDNDTTLATVLSTDATAAENPSDNGEFTVYLDHVNHTGSPITVNYNVTGSATEDEDYMALAGDVGIADGESTAVIIVDTTGLDDGNGENTETVNVTLTSTNQGLVSVGSPSSALVNIADDDSFSMNIETTQDGSESGSTDIVYTISLNHPNTTGNAITATLSDTGTGTATTGDDYDDFGGMISIPNGQQSTTYTVTVIDDDDLETTESVGATISDSSEGDLGIATATATLTDNEIGSMSIAATAAGAAENPSINGQFTVTLSNVNHSVSPIELTYTVNGTATGGQDYTALSGHAMIASGQSTTTVTVNTDGKNDAVHEGDETVIVTLATVDHPWVTIVEPDSATVTITDDDPTPRSTTKTPIKTIVPTTITENSNVPIDTPEVVAVIPVDQVPEDLDSDDVSDDQEKKAYNHGDGNGDGIPDMKQQNVASLVSPVTNKPVTLEVLGECINVKHFEVVPESKLVKQDKHFNYPQGLVDYKLGCDKPGQNANVTVYFSKQYDNVAKWRKFNATSTTFDHLTSIQSLVQPVGPDNISTVQYSLADGGAHDDDGTKNGIIIDPAGPAVRAFYIFDLGWLIPVALGGWFIGRSIHHRHRDYKSHIR